MMISGGHDFQVIGVVIVLVVIDVVNVLTRCDRSTDFLFSHHAMRVSAEKFWIGLRRQRTAAFQSGYAATHTKLVARNNDISASVPTLPLSMRSTQFPIELARRKITPGNAACWQWAPRGAPPQSCKQRVQAPA